MVLFLLFVVLPIAELYLIIQVGVSIGAFNTFVAIVLVALVGSWVVKREGLRVWSRFNQTIAQGRVPTREIVDGVLLLAAGALLVTPGFITDAVGLLALFPPTRAFFRALLMRRAARGTVILGGFGTARYRGGESVTDDVIDTDGTEPHGEI